ncbi:MAG: transposase [Saprospiraceae bacterium]|nr:transposase [Saprospiraceae bacterium]MBK6785489.1 transposase [Saprospiraceae bacterium]MBK8080435.1 transposase [Saprospiraceae bacterium]MBK8371319.1 transposase [Saprospiraceae bacterium]MBK8819597.1 transposase [Saprospiraceae bacterium]
MQKKESGTKKFTDKEKLQIIDEVKKNGLKVTLAKYDLFQGTYYYWKRKLLIYGDEGLQHKKSTQNDQLIKKLERENEQLKILLAEKELESKLKDEVIKKKYPEWKKHR